MNKDLISSRFDDVGVEVTKNLDIQERHQTMIHHTNEYEVLTPSGWQSFDGVLVTPDRKTIRVEFDDTSHIDVTDNHIFIDEFGVECISIDSVNRNIKSNNFSKKVVSIKEKGKTETVYDLVNVSGGNVYFTNDVCSHNCLVLDEFAFLSPSLAEEFVASVFPTISSSKSSQMIIVSTPKGMNHYYKLWVEAEQGINGFKAIEGKWQEHPKRDQAWADEQRAILGDVKYSQEILTSFIGSSNTLVKGEKIAALALRQPITNSLDGFVAYEAPTKKASYVMTVDVAEGKEMDSSAFVIFDISKLPYRIVATYKNNAINTLAYPEVIHHYAKMYNDAFVLVESNSLGQQVADALFYDIEYENMYMSAKEDVIDGFGGSARPGIKTTKKTKAIGCNAIKAIIENDNLDVGSAEVVDEMSTFVRVGSTYKAEEGKHDDLMMCCVTFGFLTQTTAFKNLFDFYLRKEFIKQQLTQIESDELPIGYFNDGLEEEPLFHNF